MRRTQFRCPKIRRTQYQRPALQEQNGMPANPDAKIQAGNTVKQAIMDLVDFLVALEPHTNEPLAQQELLEPRTAALTEAVGNLCEIVDDQD